MFYRGIKLNYEEAFVKVIKDIFKRWRNKDWGGLMEDVCKTLEKLDDQKRTIQFAAQIIDRVLIAPIEVENWAINFFNKKGSESKEIAEKPEKNIFEEMEGKPPGEDYCSD